MPWFMGRILEVSTVPVGLHVAIQGAPGHLYSCNIEPTWDPSRPKIKDHTKIRNYIILGYSV